MLGGLRFSKTPRPCALSVGTPRAFDVRRVFCVHYRSCLNSAWADDLSFDCSACTKYEPEQLTEEDIMVEADGAADLIVEIIRPSDRQAYRCTTGKNSLPTLSGEMG